MSQPFFLTTFSRPVLGRVILTESCYSDIVDHEPSDGNIWKMLLGSTNDYYDSQNETQQTTATPSNEGSSMMMAKEYT